MQEAAPPKPRPQTLGPKPETLSLREVQSPRERGLRLARQPNHPLETVQALEAFLGTHLIHSKGVSEKVESVLHPTLRIHIYQSIYLSTYLTNYLFSKSTHTHTHTNTSLPG